MYKLQINTFLGVFECTTHKKHVHISPHNQTKLNCIKYKDYSWTVTIIKL